MAAIKYQSTQPVEIRPGVFRRLGYTNNLMVALIDFENGPTDKPDPHHAHPHEQVTYIAEGEVIFYIVDEAHRLGPGDMITVPSGVPHTIQLLTQHARLVDTFTPIRQDFLE